jgi:hypothetical protein
MPHMGWVAMNGLNDWVIVLSGELSMTSVCDVVPEPDEAVGGLLDEHAAAPAARATAAVTVTSFLGPSILVMIIFVSCRRNGRYPPNAER